MSMAMIVSGGGIITKSGSDSVPGSDSDGMIKPGSLVDNWFIISVGALVGARVFTAFTAVGGLVGVRVFTAVGGLVGSVLTAVGGLVGARVLAAVGGFVGARVLA